jgi:hypothetical protein
MPSYKLSNRSVTSAKSELELFSVPPTQTNIIETIPIELLPTNTLTDSGPYTFRLPPDNLMLDVYHNELYMRIKIVDNVDAALAPLNNVHPAVGSINLIGKTIFSQVKLYINGKLVEDSGDKYAYRVFLETELNFGDEAKKSHLQSSFYFPDAAAHMNVAQNDGLTARSTPFRLSREVEVVGKIHCDLFNQEKCLPSNMELRLELHKNRDPFNLLCYGANAPAYKLKIVDMRWKVWKVRPSEEFSLALETVVQTEPMRYPIRRIQINSIHVDAGRRSAPNNVLITGQLPRRMIIGMVNTNAFHGAYDENPFNFEHFNISSINLLVSGRTIPSYAIPIDFANNLYLRHYKELMSVLEMSETNIGNSIGKARYISGSTFFGFDLSPDHDPDGGHWDLVKEGTVSLDIRFSAAIANPGVEIIVYSEYENMVEFDRLRNVSYDYMA